MLRLYWCIPNHQISIVSETDMTLLPLGHTGVAKPSLRLASDLRRPSSLTSHVLLCLDIAAEQKQRNLCSFRSLSLTYVPSDHWHQSTVGNASDHFKPIMIWLWSRIMVPRKLVDKLKQQNLFESHSKRAQLKCYLAWLVCVCVVLMIRLH